MFSWFRKKIAMRLETGETIPCKSVGEAERKAFHRALYVQGSKTTVLRNGKPVSSTSSAK